MGHEESNVPSTQRGTPLRLLERIAGESSALLGREAEGHPDDPPLSLREDAALSGVLVARLSVGMRDDLGRAGRRINVPASMRSV